MGCCNDSGTREDVYNVQALLWIGAVAVPDNDHAQHEEEVQTLQES